MQQIINQILNRKSDATKPQAKRDCNFRDNYYGDQLCRDVVTKHQPKA